MSESPRYSHEKLIDNESPEAPQHTVIQFVVTPTTADVVQDNTIHNSSSIAVKTSNHDDPLPMRSEEELSPSAEEPVPAEATEKEVIKAIMRTGNMSDRQKTCYLFFEHPRTVPARLFAGISAAFIFISGTMVACETLPTFFDGEDGAKLTKILLPVDTLIVVWWTIELFGRFYASPEKMRFFTRFFNIIDVFSILPFFLLLSGDSASSAFRYIILFDILQSAINVGRTFRVIRILKVFKLARYSVGIQLALKALRRSLDAIWMLAMMLLLAMLASSTVMYWAERGTFNSQTQQWERADGSRSPFQSIPEGFYWSITTLATVGYGDVVPVTLAGRILASMTMTVSILTIALPTSIIGSNFMAEWQLNQRVQIQRKVRKNRERKLKIKNFTASKADQIRTLTEQNALMLQTIGEIQEKLNDINPPQYYQAYKDLREQQQQSLAELDELKREVDKWKRAASDASAVRHAVDDFLGGETLRKAKAAAPHFASIFHSEHRLKGPTDDSTVTVNSESGSNLARTLHNDLTKKAKTIIHLAKGKTKKSAGNVTAVVEEDVSAESSMHPADPIPLKRSKSWTAETTATAQRRSSNSESVEI